MLCKFLVLLFAILIKICFGNETCLSSENKKWNAKKSSCVECQSCDPGWFRNLSQEYYGPTVVHGHTRCLPCSECPKGTYSDGYSNGCALCLNCTSLYREYGSACTGEEDANCGSCIRGYYDAFRSTKQPCLPESSLEESQKPTLTQESKPPADTLSEENNINYLKDKNQESSSESALSVVLIAVAFVGSAFAAFAFVAYFRPSLIRRRMPVQNMAVERQQVEQDSSSQVTMQEPLLHMTSELSEDNDLQIDAGAANTERKSLANNQCCVRAELQTRGPTKPRGELTNLVTGEFSTRGGCFRLSDDRDRIYALTQTSSYKFCHCKPIPNCECKDLILKCSDVTISASDSIITTVATHVCHDPTGLFRNLELDSAIIYQENNTRDRDPEKITESELVTRLLNIWTQRQTNLGLKTLLSALCEANFHCICKEISSHYISQCTERNDVKSVNKICDKAVEKDSTKSSNESSNQNTEDISETSAFLYDHSINSSLT